MADVTPGEFISLYPDLIPRAIRVYNDIKNLTGLEMRPTEGVRTFSRQASLYAQGRTKPGSIVTNAKAGYSLHHYGCAFDSCFVGTDPYLKKNPLKSDIFRAFGRLAEAHGFVWGGDWDGDGDESDQTLYDTPHLQLTYGLALPDMIALYKAGGMKRVWERFDSVRGAPLGQDWTGPQPRSIIPEMGPFPS